jgi:hypothetical protein
VHLGVAKPRLRRADTRTADLRADRRFLVGPCDDSAGRKDGQREGDPAEENSKPSHERI